MIKIILEAIYLKLIKTLYVVMKVAKSKYCVICKDMEIIIILDILLVKSGKLTRILQADPKLETMCMQSFVVLSG